MLVIVARDGVINYHSSNHVRSPKEWRPIPHSLKAIARLNHEGHFVVVATNQSGVGRGYYSADMLEAIHRNMREELSTVGGHLDGIYTCPHVPEDACSCRKPRPGLLMQIAQDFSVDLKQTYCIGDSVQDMQAAQCVGALPILVRTGNGEETLKACRAQQESVPVYADLSAVVSAIIGGTVS